MGIHESPAGVTVSGRMKASWATKTDASPGTETAVRHAGTHPGAAAAALHGGSPIGEGGRECTGSQNGVI